MRHFVSIALSLWIIQPTLHAGLISTNQLYQETGGIAGGQAEFYHAVVSTADAWTEIASGFANPLGAYMQSLPDNGQNVTWGAGPSIDYLVSIQTPGTYQLYLRWDGSSGDSDSIFAGLVELADGAGGVADWYEDAGHSDSDFNTEAWDGTGEAEVSSGTTAQDPMTWNIVTPGIYTLRIAMREDGSAVDAWVLQLESLPPPTGVGGVFPVPDELVMHWLSKAGIPVLRNDLGAPNPATLEIVNAPSFGTAVPRTDGTILYEHTAGSPAADTFSYRVQDVLGAWSSEETVSVTFSSDLRLPNSTVYMPQEAPPATYQVVNAFPALSFSIPLTIETPPGETNRLFVLQRSGHIFAITNLADATAAPLFMDLSARVDDDGNEEGLKSIAFHPGYATNRYFYLSYCHRTNSTDYVRLSRFETQAGDPNQGDADSELILIQQEDNGPYHNIDHLTFGPDGYLYIGFGDEGPQNDGNMNSQRIDKDIWSALVRIDVDKLPGHPEPNPHAGIPTDGGGLAHFSIPLDNPYLGATQFNGVAVNPAEVRTEFFAVGFRNPWQFSIDPLTGDIWVGDVGNASWEEVSMVTNGGNYGWGFYEGTHDAGIGFLTPPVDFVHSGPVWDYPHGSGEFAGNAVTGGIVYRGTRYASLYGKYIFSDFVSGNIWTLDFENGQTNVNRIAGEGGVVQFGLHPATGEILMVDINDGVIRRLEAEVDDGAFPLALSDTGFFADLTDLTPNPGVVPYQANLPFWSDYAIKQRWFVITNLTDTVTYDLDGPWMFPTGMMWVKHFDLELTRGDSNTARRIETRVLTRTPEGAHGVSYKWNEGQTDAFLVGDAGEEFDLSVVDGGSTNLQTYHIPSRAECLSCHLATGGHALSFNARQLNRDGTLSGQAGNQLDLLAQAGYVTNFNDSVNLLPRHVRPDETEYSLEARVRSYLAVNCAYCHQAGSGSTPATWDGRPELRLTDTGVVLGPAFNNGGDPANLLVVPGDPAHSIILNRISLSNGFTRMPPIASKELDPVSIQLVTEWISQQLPAYQTYDQWRLAQYGNTTSAVGERAANGDGDRSDNETEWLGYSDPHSGTNYWSDDYIAAEAGAVTVGYALSNRHVYVERSTNLVEWSTWDVPGNHGIPLNTGMVHEFTDPAVEGKAFYRFRIEEN